MDLAYLREHPTQLPTFIKHQRIRTTPVPGGDICTTERLTLDDGTSLFAKSLEDPPEGFFAAEAAGLRWLREAGEGAVPVPEVIAELPEMLVLEWIEPGDATPAAADRFGRELAALHRAGAPAFGADWRGYIGALPLSNTAGEDWPSWFAEHRLEPYVRISVDSEVLSAEDVALIDGLLSRIDR